MMCFADKETGMAFQKVVIIGYGKVTGDILIYVKERQKDYGCQLEFIEHEIHPFSITEKICSENGIPFVRIEDKRELAAYLHKIREKTLLISASNNFLFPKSLVEKENVTIINFHNALLPAYPGRNAPSWVIFMGEKETGITWHYVTAGIDEGNIIIQRTCAIGEDVKAYELTEQLMTLAYEAFKACFDMVMEERAEAREQGFEPGRRMYRSYEVPSDGVFDLTEDTAQIYRLLRSVDYGKAGIFPVLRTKIDGQAAQILRYRKVPAAKQPAISDGGTETEGFIYLPLGEDSMLKLKYRKME